MVSSAHASAPAERRWTVAMTAFFVLWLGFRIAAMARESAASKPPVAPPAPPALKLPIPEAKAQRPRSYLGAFCLIALLVAGAVALYGSTRPGKPNAVTAPARVVVGLAATPTMTMGDTLQAGDRVTLIVEKPEPAEPAGHTATTIPNIQIVRVSALKIKPDTITPTTPASVLSLNVTPAEAQLLSSKEATVSVARQTP